MKKKPTPKQPKLTPEQIDAAIRVGVLTAKAFRASRKSYEARKKSITAMEKISHDDRLLKLARAEYDKQLSDLF